jgi:hypothetical protein
MGRTYFKPNWIAAIMAGAAGAVLLACALVGALAILIACFATFSILLDVFFQVWGSFCRIYLTEGGDGAHFALLAFALSAILFFSCIARIGRTQGALA